VKGRASATQALERAWRMPAEWEPHRATWFAWPHNQWDWPGKHGSIPWVFAEAMRLLAPAERIRLLVGNATERLHAARVLERGGVPLEQVDFVKAATNRSWTRDSLPLFVTRRRCSFQQSEALSLAKVVSVSKAGKQGELRAIKWRFNGWARYPNHADDDAAGRLVAETFAASFVFPLEPRGSRVVLEGGSVEVDGLGTLLTTEACLVSGKRARGKRLGKAGYERLFAEHLGVERVIWLPDGIAGDDTSGHVDDFCRFAGPGKVVLCREPKRSDPNHANLERARRVITAASDARGKKLEIIDLPMPSPVYDGRHRLPASYANFYIGNAAVLVPTFNDPNDRVALRVLEQAFHNRPVVGVHCRELVLGLGTLHCSTQQEPVA
jgi:agmatine deiminase